MNENIDWVNKEPIKKETHVDIYNEQKALEFIKCAHDVKYFIETYVQVKDSATGFLRPFILFDYQNEALRNFQKYRNNILMFSRQMGKSELTTVYLLHHAMFNPNKTILIVGNKLSTAVEMMDRIKFQYKDIPDFLRDAVVEFNKTTITFKNGSKIICRATTPDAARGLSVSILAIDEFSFLSQKLAQSFWSAVRPTLSNGGSCIITSTPGSDEDLFAQIWRGANDTILPNGELSDVGSNGFKATFAKWSDRPGRDQQWADDERAALGDVKFRIEHECQFISQKDTLIDPLALTRLKSQEPILKMGEVRWFSNPEPNKAYYVCLDPSLGTRNDSSAIQVIEMPTMKHVAEWRSNSTAPRGQVQVLYDILKFIHNEIDSDNDDPDIFWSFENNSIGEAVLQILEDSDLDSFPGTLISEKRPPQQKSRFRRGLNTTNKNKVIACSKFKSLVDTDRFKPLSAGAITQLKNFTANGASYSAKGTDSDDLVMALILCVRLIEMTKDWDIYDPEILEDKIEKEYREPVAFTF